MPKGFGYGGESANQERSNLLKDNPVARTAGGDRPWISRHYKSTMRSAKPSPMNDGHLDSETSPNQFNQELVNEANKPGSTMNEDFKKEVLKAGVKGAKEANSEAATTVAKNKSANAMAYDAANAMYDTPASKKGKKKKGDSKCHHNV
tara:strand:- start:76 stop:519 length:444 start_codon:yes stop_codon:yes gene_type:complete